MLRRLLSPLSATLLPVATLLTGCFSMEMTELEPPSGLEKLIAVSDSTIPTSLDPQGLNERSLGHQYLFFAIPLTRVYVPSLERDTLMELSVACGMRGYRCESGKPSSSTRRSLSIMLRDVSVNGYDLLVVRKPTASVTLAGTLTQDGVVTRSCEESVSATNTSHYAFNAELQHALGEALLQASYKLLDCLGLTGAS